MAAQQSSTNHFVSVGEAERIILSHTNDFGTETISFDKCLGRVLAEDIQADRDLPPFDRVTMDGIAIKFEAIDNGIFSFDIKDIQSAGGTPIELRNKNECIEIMTGSALPQSADTIIPYEDIDISNGMAAIKTSAIISRNQNIHFRGKDKRKDEVLAEKNQMVTPAIVTIMSAVGKVGVLVKKQPKIIIISTGDELVDVDETPAASQVRRSNNYTLQSALRQFSLTADMKHLPDDEDIIEQELKQCLQNYDVILLSGGVSMGKFDHVPAALEKLQAEKLFHKIKQRPGKPFWFGKYPGPAFVFAFPGNPVSSFMCFHRYFLPWIKKCFSKETAACYAVLNEDFYFAPALQYFLQVKLHNSDKGQILATPVEGNGSGDFVNLLLTDAFMELPLEKDTFKKGEVYRIWPFRQFL